MTPSPPRCSSPGALLGLLACVGLGCAGATPTPASKRAGAEFTMAQGADLSRCDPARLEQGQVLTNAASLGQEDPNIERVYELSISREEGPRTLRCRRVDTNLDGEFDVLRSYDERGLAYSEQADADFDGVIETWVRFARGRVIEERRDNNGDGNPDELRIYSNGKLSRMRRDRDFDGRVDTWEVYDGTRLHRMGLDLDGDGRVDKWIRDARTSGVDRAGADSPPSRTGSGVPVEQVGASGSAPVPASSPNTTATASGASPQGGSGSDPEPQGEPGAKPEAARAKQAGGNTNDRAPAPSTKE